MQPLPSIQKDIEIDSYSGCRKIGGGGGVGNLRPPPFGMKNVLPEF